jgi:hypothetical protein
VYEGFLNSRKIQILQPPREVDRDNGASALELGNTFDICLDTDIWKSCTNARICAFDRGHDIGDAGAEMVWLFVVHVSRLCLNPGTSHLNLATEILQGMSSKFEPIHRTRAPRGNHSSMVYPDQRRRMPGSILASSRYDS